LFFFNRSNQHLETEMAEQTAEEKAAAATKAEEQAKLKAAKEADEKAAAALAEERKGLVRVTKDGTDLYVHPTTVANHESIGWKVVG
jgi:hypothetical protein